MTWMNEAYTADAFLSFASTEYQENQPFPHIQLENFLALNKLAELEQALSEQEFIHKESDLFSLAQTENLETVDHPVIKEFLEFMNSEETRAWFEQLTGVATTPGNIDCFGAIYQDTDYLLCHDDQLDDRKLAWILYLTTLEKEQGGALALYTDSNGVPQTRVIEYQPTQNTLALFTVSETSWHEVQEVTDEAYRVSIGGWLRC